MIGIVSPSTERLKVMLVTPGCYAPMFCAFKIVYVREIPLFI